MWLDMLCLFIREVQVQPEKLKHLCVEPHGRSRVLIADDSLRDPLIIYHMLKKQ